LPFPCSTAQRRNTKKVAKYANWRRKTIVQNVLKVKNGCCRKYGLYVDIEMEGKVPSSNKIPLIKPRLLNRLFFYVMKILVVYNNVLQLQLKYEMLIIS